MPFHDREAALNTSLAALAARDAAMAGRLAPVLRSNLVKEREQALKDPAAYAADLLRQLDGQAGDNAHDATARRFTKELAAERSMAMQKTLFASVPGFTPRVLTARDANAAHTALADPKTGGAAKLKTLLQLKESYGNLGEAAIAELELAPAVMAAADLAAKAPERETFAAGLLEAALGSEAENAVRRLYAQAGNSPEAREALAALMAPQPPLDDTNAYQVAGPAGRAGPAVAPPSSGPAEGEAAGGQSFSDEFLGRIGDIGLGIVEAPGSVLHGGIKAINATADLIYDGMDWLQEKGWFWTDDPIQRLAIPNLPDPKNPAGKMASGISQFLVGFKGYDKALKGLKAASYGTNAIKSAGTGALADFTVFDGQEERFSNLVQQYPALANPFTEFLAAKPGDSKAEGRLKNALEGLGLGAVAEAALYGLRTFKAGRELTKGEMREAAETLVAQKQGRAAIKKHIGTAPGMDYTDTRSPDTMRHAGKELREIPVTEADRLHVGSGNNKGFYSERNARRLVGEIEQQSGAKVSPVETVPGQWKIRVDSVPSLKSPKELQSIVDDLYEKNMRGQVEKARIGVAGPHEAAKIKAETGYDVLLYKHELNGDDIAHAIERHNKQAAAIGEIPIHKADIARYPEIITKPDKISRSDKPGSIIYEKRFPDGSYYITEQIIQKGNKLEFKTMYKNKVAETMRPSLITTLPAKIKGRNVNEPADK